MDNPIEDLKPKKSIAKKIKKGISKIKIKRKSPVEIELEKFDGIMEHIQDWSGQELTALSKNISNLARAKKPKKKWSKKMGFGSGILLSLAIPIVIFLLIMAIGVYGYEWNNKYAKGITKVVRFPVALVDYLPISYYNYLIDYNAIAHFNKKQKELSPDTPTQTKEEIKDTVLDKIINDKIVAVYAKNKYDIKVSQEDVDKEYDMIASQSATPDELETTVKDLYNWDIETFKNRIIKPYIVLDKLQEAMGNDPEYSGAAEEKAQQVLELVKAGDQTFEELAQEYSEDPGSAANGGELGPFGRGVMVPEFEEAAFALGEGEISDLVKTDYGYHIIKVTKINYSEKNPEEIETIEASHILIRLFDFDAWLEEYKESVKVWKWI